MGLFDFFKKKSSSSEPQKTKKCPHCGSAMAAEDSFCRNCGKPFDEPKTVIEEPKKEEKKICPHCGAFMGMEDKFCPTCGKGFNDPIVIGSMTQKVETPVGDVDIKVEMTAPTPGVFETGTHERNGIVFKMVEERDSDGGCFAYDVALYNEVYFYYAFLRKYGILKKPELAKGSDFGSFYWKNFDIKDIKKFYKEMAAKGFYEKARPEEVLSMKKVSELKEIIAKLGIKVKGKKDALIEGIVATSDPNALSEVIGDEYLSISDSGKSWMKEHADEYDYYTSDDEWESFDAYKNFWKTHDRTTEAIKKAKREIKADRDQFGRYEYDTLIGLYKEKGGMEKDILTCYMKELLIDLSGVCSYQGWKLLRWDIDPKYDSPDISFIAYTEAGISEYKDFYDPSMIDEVYQLNLPLNACPKETYQEIIDLIFDDALDSSTKEEYEEKLKQNAYAIARSKRSHGRN